MGVECAGYCLALGVASAHHMDAVGQEGQAEDAYQRAYQLYWGKRLTGHDLTEFHSDLVVSYCLAFRPVFQPVFSAYECLLLTCGILPWGKILRLAQNDRTGQRENWTRTLVQCLYFSQIDAVDKWLACAESVDVRS